MGQEYNGGISRIAKHITPDAASEMGPPVPGDLAAPILSAEDLDVDFYAPPAVDRQQPHARDEVYVVARGHARFRDGAQRHAVDVGSFLFVPAGQPHRFEDVSEGFAVWVIFFGPERRADRRQD